MAEGFEVGHASGELDDETRHALVAAQLRGEEKAKGRDTDAVIASVAEEIRGLGLEPDQAELERRYAAIDPDLPVTSDTEDVDGQPVERRAGQDAQAEADLVTQAEMTPTPTGDEPRRGDGA
ncbi:hypothetical protein BJM39_02315 [Salmonella enterica subsp. enterica serovar Javiana]|nr:hypothetical protein BJM39_02315 [Salmonella enterica subsp. enterica serovar Javiana]